MEDVGFGLMFPTGSMDIWFGARELEGLPALAGAIAGEQKRTRA